MLGCFFVWTVIIRARRVLPVTGVTGARVAPAGEFAESVDFAADVILKHSFPGSYNGQQFKWQGMVAVVLAVVTQGTERYKVDGDVQLVGVAHTLAENVGTVHGALERWSLVTPLTARLLAELSEESSVEELHWAALSGVPGGTGGKDSVVRSSVGFSSRC